MNARAFLFASSLAVLAAGIPFPADAAGPAAAPTAADRQAAAKDFAEGQRAFTLGDYPRAGQLFESAYGKAPHHSSLWNAARSWQRAGEIARAANLYARYLREAPANAPDRNSSSAALQKLTPKLARLDVHAGPGLTGIQVDGEPIDNPSVYVTPGTHLVEAMAGEQKVQQTQRADAGAVIAVALLAPPPPKPKQEPPKPAPAPPPSSKLPPLVVYVGGAVTLALAGATVWSGLDTWSQKDAFDSAPTQANLDEGHARQKRTNWLLGATGGAALLTTVAAVWLVDWKRTASEQPDKQAGSLQLGLGPGSVRLQGSF